MTEVQKNKQNPKTKAPKTVWESISEENKDFFFQFLEKKVRNNNKKLKEINRLEELLQVEKKDLKPEQLEKVASKEEVISKITEWEGIATLWIEAFKEKVKEEKKNPIVTQPTAATKVAVHLLLLALQKNPLPKLQNLSALLHATSNSTAALATTVTQELNNLGVQVSESVKDSEWTGFHHQHKPQHQHQHQHHEVVEVVVEQPVAVATPVVPAPVQVVHVHIQEPVQVQETVQVSVEQPVAEVVEVRVPAPVAITEPTYQIQRKQSNQLNDEEVDKHRDSGRKPKRTGEYHPRGDRDNRGDRENRGENRVDNRGENRGEHRGDRDNRGENRGEHRGDRDNRGENRGGDRPRGERQYRPRTDQRENRNEYRAKRNDKEDSPKHSEHDEEDDGFQTVELKRVVKPKTEKKPRRDDLERKDRNQNQNRGTNPNNEVRVQYVPKESP